MALRPRNARLDSASKPGKTVAVISRAKRGSRVRPSCCPAAAAADAAASRCSCLLEGCNDEHWAQEPDPDAQGAPGLPAPRGWLCGAGPLAHACTEPGAGEEDTGGVPAAAAQEAGVAGAAAAAGAPKPGWLPLGLAPLALAPKHTCTAAFRLSRMLLSECCSGSGTGQLPPAAAAAPPPPCSCGAGATMAAADRCAITTAGVSVPCLPNALRKPLPAATAGVRAPGGRAGERSGGASLASPMRLPGDASSGVLVHAARAETCMLRMWRAMRPPSGSVAAR